MFAIVEIQGKQYKVTTSDTIEVDRLKEEKGKVSFDTVLMYAKDEKNVEIGSPYVKGAKVEAEILENIRGEKLRVFKMKSKKRYSKTIGHRRNLTVLEIKNISTGGKVAAVPAEKAEAKPKKAPAKKAAAPKAKAEKAEKEDS